MAGKPLPIRDAEVKAKSNKLKVQPSGAQATVTTKRAKRTEELPLARAAKAARCAERFQINTAFVDIQGRKPKAENNKQKV